MSDSSAPNQLDPATANPRELMQALPYLAALVALAGLAGRVRAPAADGIPYVAESARSK